MKNKRLIALIFAYTLTIQPLTAHAYSFSWQDFSNAPIQSITNYFDKETINKLIPFAIIASLISIVGFYYWMSKKNTSVDYYYQWTLSQPEILKTLSQLQVYSQTNIDGGGGASCGYQTLLRAMQIVAAKAENNENEKKLETTLVDQKAIADYFGSPESEWRKEIINKRKNDEIKKLLDTKLSQNIKENNALKQSNYDEVTINKAKELYKSSLVAIEDLILTKINTNQHYNFTNEEIKTLIKEKVIIPEEEKYKELAKNINTDPMINDFFNFVSKDIILELQTNIKTIQTSTESGEWLNDGEMEFLWETNKYQFIPNTVSYGFKAISNFDFIGQEGFDEVTPYIKETIKPKLNKSEQFFQIFALGTMKQYSDTSGSQGHWYPLIMHQKTNGTRTYFITDSLDNKTRTRDKNALALIGMIEKPENNNPDSQ